MNGLAVHIDYALVTLDDPIDRRQSQASASSHSLCCEKWIKNPLLGLLIHPGAVSVMEFLIYFPGLTL
jgi:hypothetical protein